MLNGAISYLGHKFDVFGYDTASDLKLRLKSNNFDSILLMADSSMQEQGDELWERGVSIAPAKITVETANEVDKTTGRRIKKPINVEMFCRLGATLRYIKSHCYVRYMEGYTGMKLASGEFEPEERIKYIIPFENKEDGEILATVELRLGNITSIHAKTDIFEIDLEDDPMLDTMVYPVFKDGVQKGFAFNKEYLGFNVNSQVLEKSTMLGGMYRNLAEVMVAHPDKEFEWLRTKNYKIVTDDMLEELCDYIYNFDGYVYYDTETTGLNINFKSRVGQADQCVGIILSVVDGESFFFPMQMKAIKNLCGGDHFYFMEHYMRRILEKKELVAHNMSFDWKVSYIYDINANIVHDTMALFKLTLGNEDEDLPVSLKHLARLFLKRDSLELDDLVIGDSWGEDDIRFWDLPEELVKYYACADTDNTRGLLKYAEQNNLLAKYNATKVYDIEIAFSYAVAYQEFYGHLFDVNKVEELRKEIQNKMEGYYKQMVDLVGHDFNPNSSKQLLTIMYEELGIPVQISRKTNRPTTDKDTLKHLGELTNLEGKAMYPFCALLLKYREYEGVRKIIDKFPELATSDGYLFPGVQQYGTRTGRVSIKAPNYQSYNKPVKKNIIPRPGYYMFDTDYSSVEYRVLGNMSGNKMIKENFYDPDFDYHTYQASRMYRVPYAAVTGTLRKAAKGINFGLPYGMGDESLGIRIFGEKSEENTRKAASLRRSYFKGQEDIQNFFENARDSGVQNGFTSTYFGRRRYYDSKKFTIPAIRRQAGNQVIQGCYEGGGLVQEKYLGLRRLDSLVNQHVEVWDGHDWTTGFVAYSGKKRKCIVRFRGGNVAICSPDHKFLVRSHRGGERFVRCEDLLPLYDQFGGEHKNAHRVVINPEYVKSEHEYSSDHARKYRGTASNAKNYYIDDLSCDSFKKGVVLGRLASDGNYNYGCCLERTSVVQIVAEHEAVVLDILKEYEKEWNPVVKTLDRDNRNQLLYHLQTYSKSLTMELQSLDIRHGIDEKIFADTEMLRGFLRGFFDGDGGISGKTITLVQGSHYDFEPLFDDIQRALTHFGIRSRYRVYDDRYVLQIKTTDNERFLERIGFINPEKQERGLQLQCKEDEHVFGKCLMVESVEITDEFIDMYDVCNTERGYYVVDGVITHNSAADIYKLAVGRVFKRICREGWLGKVMLTGFIHDELLGEVSTEIDPMKWLKVLREEFEVKVYDQNGEPWCPLYMGFGWGRSWEEAKSTEIPIKLQWEFVEKYGETGYPSWDKDIDKFCDKVPDLLRDFEIRDCGNQLLAEESQGKEIKPALNSAILGVLKADAKYYPEVLKDESLRDVYHISGSITDSEGNIIPNVPETKDTQEAITYFCMLHSLDRSKINVLNISDVTISNEGMASESDVIHDSEYDYEDEAALALKRKNEMLLNRISVLGMFVDIDNHEVVGLLLPMDMMNVIKGRLKLKETKPNGFDFKLVDLSKNMKYNTPYVVDSVDISGLQSIYTTYLNLQNKKQA